MTADQFIRLCAVGSAVPWWGAAVAHATQHRWTHAALCVTLGVSNVLIYLIG